MIYNYISKFIIYVALINCTDDNTNSTEKRLFLDTQSLIVKEIKEDFKFQ